MGHSVAIPYRRHQTHVDALGSVLRAIAPLVASWLTISRVSLNGTAVGGLILSLSRFLWVEGRGERP